MVVVGVVVAVVSVFEPMFVSSLLGEGKTRWDFGEWASQLLELGTPCPDLFIVPMLGLWIWLSDRPRRHRPGHLVAGGLRNGPDHGCQAGLGTQLLYEPPNRGSDGNRARCAERPGSHGAGLRAVSSWR